MENSEVSVGIDLGTTFSAVAHLDNEGDVRLIVKTVGGLSG